jgi:hypothetical protein
VTAIAIDHVIMVVDNLDEASDRLYRVHGLASIAGGRHAGHGTANRIVPLGESYLELMGVIDGDEAAASPMGRWALANRLPGLVPAALCLRTDDADNEAARLGLEPMAMSRTRPDGIVLSWRLVGADDMFGDRRLPFYIQWDDLALHPGRSIAHHRVNPFGIGGVVLSGDTAAIHRRIGGADVPVIVLPGPPGVRSVTIRTHGESIVIGQ